MVELTWQQVTVIVVLSIPISVCTISFLFGILSTLGMIRVRFEYPNLRLLVEF